MNFNTGASVRAAYVRLCIGVGRCQRELSLKYVTLVRQGYTGSFLAKMREVVKYVTVRPSLAVM